MNSSTHDTTAAEHHVTIRWRGFAAIALTVVLNVLVHYSGLPQIWRISLHLLLATVQAALVAVHSMHLMAERNMVRWVLIFTVLFTVLLFGLCLLGYYDTPRL